MYIDHKHAVEQRKSGGLRGVVLLLALAASVYLWEVGKHGLHTMPIEGDLGLNPVLYGLAWLGVLLAVLFGLGASKD